MPRGRHRASEAVTNAGLPRLFTRSLGHSLIGTLVVAVVTGRG